MRKAARPLPDGKYRAVCREKNALAAGINGHSLIYPEAEVELKNGTATFRKDGKIVWSCNAEYAAVHFSLEPT
ncbi:hypothetical protein [Burkholderia ubonensis]|uniref:hypothetical protein n=1 Tax=Burkholderia ubonensis TaxID=101571 RepID=UPI00075F6980|nr:hypothetical protein [Burkholderia ubonensis]KVV07367.1 hypothetical protein WK77_16390 [Burkholderia ubonensis]